MFIVVQKLYRQPQLLKWRHISMKLTNSISFYKYNDSSRDLGGLMGIFALTAAQAPEMEL